MNVELSKNAKTDLEKDVIKLMNNASLKKLWKMCENIEVSSL